MGMLEAALFKYYGPANIDKMDIPEFVNALEVAGAAGMPKELIDKIYKKKADSAYLEMMMPRGGSNGV